MQLPFGEHVGRDHPDLLDGLLVSQQVEEAERKQPAVDFPDARVVVQQGEHGADDPVVDLRDDGQLRHVQVLQSLGDVFHLARGHRHEAPGVGQRAVVDRQEHLHFVQEARRVQRPDANVVALDDLLAQGLEFLRNLRQHGNMAPESVEILRLAEAIVLVEPLIVRRVVGHHEGGRRIEPVDQQTQLVVERRVGRTAHLGDTLVGKPAAGSVEQPIGHFLIVHALEKAKEAAQVVIPVDVSVIEDGADPTTYLTAPIGQECLDPVSVVERVGPVADHLLLVGTQRWNPVRIVAVQSPRQLDELFSLVPGGNRLDDKFGHGGPTLGGSVLGSLSYLF